MLWGSAVEDAGTSMYDHATYRRLARPTTQGQQLSSATTTTAIDIERTLAHLHQYGCELPTRCHQGRPYNYQVVGRSELLDQGVGRIPKVGFLWCQCRVALADDLPVHSLFNNA